MIIILSMGFQGKPKNYEICVCYQRHLYGCDMQLEVKLELLQLLIKAILLRRITMNYYTTYKSPLGDIIIFSDDQNLLGLCFLDESNILIDGFTKSDNLPILIKTMRWLNDYFSLKRPSISKLPMKLEGTAFQLSVWDKLIKIPYGEVTTYGKIARMIATEKGVKRMSAQAVGGAVGKNPIPIVIPCHRVIGANNKITGYSGGLDRKIGLLKHEGIDVSKMS